MATVNLTSKNNVDTTNDSVVIVNHLEGIAGGRTLDVTGFADAEISAGHVIIKETATGEYKPLPTSGTLPEGHTYAGILVASIETAKAMAAIMVRGTVNEAYAKYAIPAGAKTALSLIRFINE
ncbi:hypothetical protein [Lutibacter maritimus]|uniref:Bacteriophage lambda head decoration protein D n=1 Tax=Lutibacter maritimus TaxID=593133 RepID=A0A1I6NS35_9FLAO|nr:hypothetical protein [Lutibacter maritimus]SFS30757.1 hypothetical protein SAMN04488006_0481 [Lutibacter maritimus]